MQPTIIAENQIVIDETCRKQLQTKGYFVTDFIDIETCDLILEHFNQHHNMQLSGGGSFWSIYSQNESYKRNTHLFLEKILSEAKCAFLHNYKTLINAFVAKAPGIHSAFDIHQDTTAMDETSYSPLSIWIPLTDVDTVNGCLYLIPGTHKYTSFYRGVSIPSRFRNITTTALSYAIPIPLKKGQALFFDNRLLHFSLPNTSLNMRVAVVCGVMPENAAYMNCYKNEQEEIELFEQQDDFVLSNPYFLKNNDKRFCEGKMVNKLPWVDDALTANSWQQIVANEKLVKNNIAHALPHAQAINEPT